MADQGETRYGTAPGEALPVKRRRIYERWQGNEQFFCWGHLVAGPNWRASIGTAFLLLAPSGIFLGFVAPYVAARTHEVILAFSIILPVLCFLFLFLTACRDPGIIPRREPDEEYLAGRKPRTQEVTVNGHKVMIRYNDTCHIYQPPRAHHCSVNDNCIERFDHHCPWVGTTIGKRNYRTFLLFVYTSTILCLYVIGVCLAQLFIKHSEMVDNRSSGDDNQWGSTFASVIPAVVLMVYCFVFMWFVGGLSFFHAYLVATNQTTYENFRYNHDNRPNPFDRGCLANCGEVWCMRTPPSQINFRAYIDDPHAVRHPDQVDLEMANNTHNNTAAPMQPPAFEHQGTRGRSIAMPNWADSAPPVHPAPAPAAAPAAAPKPPLPAAQKARPPAAYENNESVGTTLPLPPQAAVANAAAAMDAESEQQRALAALAASSPYAVPHSGNGTTNGYGGSQTVNNPLRNH